MKLSEICVYCGNKLFHPTVIKENDTAICPSCSAKPRNKRVMKICSKDNLRKWR